GAAVGLRLAETDRALAPGQVPNRLAPLALHLADPVPAERPEQLPVKGQAALDRGDDEVDVVYAAGAHGPTQVRRAARESYVAWRAGGPLPLSPRDEPGEGGRGALHRQARLRPDRPARSDRRGPDLVRGRCVLERARRARLQAAALRARARRRQRRGAAGTV